MKISRILCLCVLIAFCALLCIPSTSSASLSRSKRGIKKILKKKGLGLAASALLAAGHMKFKKKILPIPIPLPIPIMKPPIIETIPIPMPPIGKFGMGGLGFGGLGGFGGMGGYG